MDFVVCFTVFDIFDQEGFDMAIQSGKNRYASKHTNFALKKK